MKSYRSLAVMAATIAGVAMPGFAQDLREASEDVVACQAIEDNLEKLTCFESAAAALSLALTAPVETAEIAPTPETPVQQATVEAPQTAPAATTEAQAPVQMAATEVASADTETLEGPPKRRLLPSWVPTVSLSIGRGESVEEPDFFETEVTRIQRNKIGRHFFTTSDGQVWRQIQIEAIRAPDVLPAKATIRQTLSGSIRLEIEDNGRSYPVNRVE